MAQPGLVKPKWFLSLMMMGIVFILIYFWYESKSKSVNSGRNVEVGVTNLWKGNLTDRPQPRPALPQSTDLKKENLSINLQMKSIMNFPEWYRKEDWGLQKDVSLENIKVECRSLHHEEITSWNNFFFGTTRGLVLELGAMNGKDFSVSAFFENQADWRTILIEGSPRLSKNLFINRNNSLNFNLVICDQPRVVHYVAIAANGLNGLDGIVEFMSPQHIRNVYPNFVGENGKLDMKKVENTSGVTKVECLPLTEILLPFKIYHINFFILDVEGGELNILKTIDFDKITFDVISVETNRGGDKAEIIQKYVDEVIELLVSKGYKLWLKKLGFNSWFVSPKFQPHSKSGVVGNDTKC